MRRSARHAGVAKLADAPDLGSGGAILAGSSPASGIFSETLMNTGRAELGIKVSSPSIVSTADQELRFGLLPTLSIGFGAENVRRELCP